MAAQYDLIVLGLGGMGSAVAAHAAARGLHVLGVEQFARNHANGASSGRSRIIRKAYFEDAAYVPMLQRAYDLWRSTERASGETLLNLVGTLIVGSADAGAVRGTLAAAQQHDLRVEQFDAAGIERRFPGTMPRPGEIGVFEPEGGIVHPEAAVRAFQSLAERDGAELRFEAVVTGYDAGAAGITVAMRDGTRATASRLAICAGPWLGKMLRDCGVVLRIQRNVQVWFRPATTRYASPSFPTFLVERAGWPAALYGFPDEGFGVKAAFHGFGDIVDPDALDRTIHDGDVEPVRRALNGWMRDAGGTLVEGKACMYSLTPDEHFIIDRHPGDGRIVIAGGFSGHGFKFCPAVGEIVTQLAFVGAPALPIDFLSLQRLR